MVSILLISATRYRETAFPCVDYNMIDSNKQQLPMHGLSRHTRGLNQSAKDRYLLLHRHFADLGLKKISKFHTLTTLDKAVKVPKDLEICEVYAIAKMKNSIPKPLANHTVSKLSLIQFDIAGPFPTPLEGNRYSLLIIDSFTRKNWILVLKEKWDAKSALKELKKAVELQANTKIKAARSDNAPELVQIIEEWKATQGTEPQFTTMTSSYQNGPAERRIGTAQASMHAMLNDASLRLQFWEEPLLWMHI
jgi:hypothetical protein